VCRGGRRERPGWFDEFNVVEAIEHRYWILAAGTARIVDEGTYVDNVWILLAVIEG